VDGDGGGDLIRRAVLVVVVMGGVEVGGRKAGGRFDSLTWYC
jgi:hypothetical protein